MIYYRSSLLSKKLYDRAMYKEDIAVDTKGLYSESFYFMDIFSEFLADDLILYYTFAIKDDYTTFFFKNETDCTLCRLKYNI